VFFIATANVLHTIPPALQDRLEILRLSGYTFQEKLAIARRFLLPRQLQRHGLGRKRVGFDDGGLEAVISGYTREAGVRELERQIARACRKIARLYVEGEWESGFDVDAPGVRELLGATRFRTRDRRRENGLGVATGLAWTAAGGELLSPEVSVVAGRGQLIVTGQLGEVMQESAQAAVTLVRARAEALGIDPGFHRRRDVHVHVPEGAIPKDGPSAGVAIAVALISTLTGVPVRADTALTGEVTLRGKVLPVGGIKEKVLAAHRAGIETVILPRENEQDLDRIPEEVSQDITVVLADSIDDVLPQALERLPDPLTMVGGDEEHSREQAH
jgi:ATP-dependent Lon protease